jgi:cytochrome c
MNAPRWNAAELPEAFNASHFDRTVSCRLNSSGFKNIACAQGGAVFGKAEFTKSCAPCHGVTGKGDGPIAKSFAKALCPQQL